MLKRTIRIVAAAAVTATAVFMGASSASARDNPTGYVCYQAHLKGIGWQDWRCDGEMAGTTGRAISIDSIRFHYPASTIEICATAHRSNYGWDSRWACTTPSNRTIQVGDVNTAAPIEAVQVYLDHTTAIMQGDAHVSNIGWISQHPGYEEYAGYGINMLGTTGRGLPLEALWLS
ncbi:hypothetical protein [Streptomyces palmae]|uniref:Hydrophobic W protein n=1 Tax=Streptomyces palmae TaxID=1701085 RepID=A0A4Z0HGY2_9ACTN|nr:hypothetical protein [Streptomyces palmae]TGB15977.1 hypothetical protein E4099_05850 [Streptomyces palmae]